MEEVLRKTNISDEAKQSFGIFETFSKHTVNVDERQELEDLVVKKRINMEIITSSMTALITPFRNGKVDLQNMSL